MRASTTKIKWDERNDKTRKNRKEYKKKKINNNNNNNVEDVQKKSEKKNWIDVQMEVRKKKNKTKILINKMYGINMI